MPKRVGRLMPLIASLENLHEAFLRTIRGKEGKAKVIQFRRNVDLNLLCMQRELLDGTFEFGKYNFFEIVDQKRRLICAASLKENIAFHAMMRICHPVFDRFQTNDSFASRLGRGQYMAIQRVQGLAGRYRWFAKLDVCKFFYSISHEVMMQQLCRLFKDRLLLQHFNAIIRSYEFTPDCGLPIGNLTSQYFANHYLAVADHWAKEHLHVAGMARYMDDMILFSDSHGELMRQVRAYCRYVNDELRLRVHEPVVNRSICGIPFLGYVVYPDTLRLTHRSQQRYRYKMSKLSDELNGGKIDEKEFAQRAKCLVSFIDKADTLGYRHWLEHMCKGIYPKEH